MFEQITGQYENYIRSRQRVKEPQVKDFSRWVENFLVFALREKIKEFDICLMRFLQKVEKYSVGQEWQVGQAKNAVHIYYHQFRKGGKQEACDPVDFIQVREKAIAVLRLKNYAYQTEDRYLSWMWRFYCFIKKNRGAGAVPVSEDIRNFLTHLALEKRVSPSTQNQAFNALLTH